MPKFRQSTFVQLESYMKPSWEAFLDDAKSYELCLDRILDDVRPDVVVQDHNMCFPTLLTRSVPFVRIVSCNPLEMPGRDVPPTYSGLSQYDRSELDAFRIEYNRVHRSMWAEFNTWVQQRGAPPLPDLQFIHESNYAKIYIYPEEADYVASRPLGDKWYRMDSSVRQTDLDYELPAAARSRPPGSSLIYLSLGTLGCADIVLMQRLIDVLSRTRHYYIVSTGSSGEQLQLSESMTG
jgi:UDP:flavonoid glycosyltransferase YjiC (YdhE family)